MQTSQQSKYDNVSNSLNRAMIPIKLAPLYLILSLLCFSAHSTATIQKPANIDARRYLFYNSSVTSMPNQQFNITFLVAFTGTPLFVYGIDEYKMNDRFDVQNFQSYSSVSSQTGFSIGVNSTGSTNVLTFSISYFATEQQISFLSDFQNVTYGQNISAFPGGTYNYRYYQATIPIAFNSSSVLAFPLLTGYYITSQTYFALNVTASVTNTTSYTFKIETGSNCAILRATFYLLFCQSTLMQANGYYSFGGINQVWSNNTINSASFTYSVYNYSQTAFLLGIRGFAGFTALNNCYWGWSTPNTTGNDMVTLTIWEKQLQFIYFSFFQIGKYITSNTTNTTTNSTNTTNVNTTNTTNSTNSSTNSTANQTYPPTSSSSAASFLPIIIGVVISIVIATIVVIVFLKFCWNKAITTLPTNAEFRQMPSISI